MCSSSCSSIVLPVFYPSQVLETNCFSKPKANIKKKHVYGCAINVTNAAADEHTLKDVKKLLPVWMSAAHLLLSNLLAVVGYTDVERMRPKSVSGVIGERHEEQFSPNTK